MRKSKIVVVPLTKNHNKFGQQLSKKMEPKSLGHSRSDISNQTCDKKGLIKNNQEKKTCH